MSQYRVQNPVTNEVIEVFDFATAQELESTLAQAQSAYESWSARPLSERCDIMRHVAQLFEEKAEELADIAALEMGKSIAEGVAEAQLSGRIIRYYADNAPELLKDQEIPVSLDGKAMIRRLPLGPLLGIMPWNFPYYQIARFAGPNMVVGNTIVLKDAEICPRSALAVQAIMDEAGVPAGVYQNIFASHEQVSEIIADPRIQGVSLTGSERAGAIVGEQAGRHLKKAVLELGGSDPYILLDTDDAKQAAHNAWAVRMYNTGQACNSNKRMIVMADIYDDFVAELVRLAKEAKASTPDARTANTYSPLSSRAAAETLAEQIERAAAAGATILAGGELAETGAYVSPAVITNLPVGSEAYYEEFFGPVATVFKVESDEEALALANNSQFGLGGAVFSQDPQRAKALASKLNVGMSNVNHSAALGPEVPFGGIKRSGFGRELGPLGIDEFVNKQMYYVDSE